MHSPQLELAMATFIMSHIRYRPLAWKLHDGALNNKTNRIHERVLRIMRKENTSKQKWLSICSHEKYAVAPQTEIYKTVNNLNLYDTSFVAEDAF